MILDELVNRSIVSIVKVDDYVYTKLYKAIQQSLELISRLTKKVKRGDNVFIKIYHLPLSSPPERGIITHPVKTFGDYFVPFSTGR
jgi:uncharacterized protein (DUF362 family)